MCRIKAVQLEYTDAFRCLQQASRKAPQQSALGYLVIVEIVATSHWLRILCTSFRKTVYKFSIIVQLLLGEIPDRSIFSQKVKTLIHMGDSGRSTDFGWIREWYQRWSRTCILPRFGNCSSFCPTCRLFACCAAQDSSFLVSVGCSCRRPRCFSWGNGNIQRWIQNRQNVSSTFFMAELATRLMTLVNRYSLIVRLRHNVIKTGLKKINLAYSHISLADVCSKVFWQVIPLYFAVSEWSRAEHSSAWNLLKIPDLLWQRLFR